MGMGAPQQASASSGRNPTARKHANDAKTTRMPDRTANADQSPFDLARLERAVTELVRAQDRLLARIDSLEVELGASEECVEGLEQRLADSEGRRGKAVEHLDGLIAQLDEIEGRLESESAPTVASPPPVSPS